MAARTETKELPHPAKIAKYIKIRKNCPEPLRVQEIVTVSDDHTDATKDDHEAHKLRQNIHDESARKHGGAKNQHAKDTTRKFNFTQRTLVLTFTKDHRRTTQGRTCPAEAEATAGIRVSTLLAKPCTFELRMRLLESITTTQDR